MSSRNFKLLHFIAINRFGDVNLSSKNNVQLADDEIRSELFEIFINVQQWKTLGCLFHNIICRNMCFAQSRSSPD